MLLGSILLDRDRHSEADAELRRATEVLEGSGTPAPELALLDYERGRSALLDGRLDDAEALARAGLDRTEATEPGTAGMLYTLLAKVALARGELEEGRRLCQEAAGVLSGTVAVHYLDDVWQTLADIEEKAGNLPAALAALRRVTAGRRTPARG
jgi:tetratricopeptide (TPR) repeat protein